MLTAFFERDQATRQKARDSQDSVCLHNQTTKQPTNQTQSSTKLPSTRPVDASLSLPKPFKPSNSQTRMPNPDPLILNPHQLVQSMPPSPSQNVHGGLPSLQASSVWRLSEEARVRERRARLGGTVPQDGTTGVESCHISENQQR